MANTYTPRFGVGTNQDSTGRVLPYAYAEPAYVATLAIVPNAYQTIYACKTLTGACTIISTLTGALVGDVLKFMFLSDGTGRTVTFGTGFVESAPTLVLTASKKAYAEFIFDGVAFIEAVRTVEA